MFTKSKQTIKRIKFKTEKERKNRKKINMTESFLSCNNVCLVNLYLVNFEIWSGILMEITVILIGPLLNTLSSCTGGLFKKQIPSCSVQFIRIFAVLICQSLRLWRFQFVSMEANFQAIISAHPSIISSNYVPLFVS